MTVSYVLPCVLSLNTHLHDMKKDMKHCSSLVDTLLSSLKRRFIGIFQKTGIIKDDVTSFSVATDFSDDIYFISAVLNPTFGIHWIDCDITGADFSEDDLEAARDQLRHMMQGMSIGSFIFLKHFMSD